MIGSAVLILAVGAVRCALLFGRYEMLLREMAELYLKC
jgi:hypothetical protein